MKPVDMTKTLAATIGLVCALAAPATAFADSPDDGTYDYAANPIDWAGDDVTNEPETQDYLRAARETWQTEPECPDNTLRVKTFEDPFSGVAGRAAVPGCTIYLDRSWLAANPDRASRCAVVAHEYGHALGHQHDPDGAGTVMTRGVEGRPAACAAFAPSVPVAAPAETPAVAAVVVVPASEVFVAPDQSGAIRMTIKLLRREAQRAAGRHRRAVACYLIGARSGACRVKMSGRVCSGRVRVGVTQDGESLMITPSATCHRPRQ